MLSRFVTVLINVRLSRGVESRRRGKSRDCVAPRSYFINPTLYFQPAAGSALIDSDVSLKWSNPDFLGHFPYVARDAGTCYPLVTPTHKLAR